MPSAVYVKPSPPKESDASWLKVKMSFNDIELRLCKDYSYKLRHKLEKNKLAVIQMHKATIKINLKVNDVKTIRFSTGYVEFTDDRYNSKKTPDCPITPYLR